MRKRLTQLHNDDFHCVYTDALDEAIDDLIVSTEAYYWTFLEGTDRNEQNYHAMMHAAARISGAVASLGLSDPGVPVWVEDPDNVPDSVMKEFVRRPYLPTPCD
ncbi:hypothetical protein C6W92_17110 [Roseovarius sp. A46]|uniref:hypothetical protein n=1 Tax=Roseovarius sp. A46 TaxID=2109331 RepID=UPI001011628B|nr:hypothetical protein [Roseovarius sp. A46]RXV58074.1 hypothetical protein C6W92_17110 [Roseovarius sp. A46]